ncbi:MAG TPA: glycosyltransferase [Casimicrobiaceae bacterium]|nr:glycosyltransferase [Casimicrobiaceae bacterium]
MRVPSIPVDEPPLRVLAITGNAIVGGMESTVLRLASRWSRNALRLTALCPFESPFTAALRALDVDVHVVPIGEKLRWHALQFAVELIREHGIAVVHTHMPAAHAIGGLAGRITHTPVLAAIHAIHLSMCDLEVHRLAGTHLCVVSEAARAHALAAGVAPARLSLIRNGVDCDRFVPRAEGSIRDAEGAMIGYVGRLSTEKHPALFLRAAALIRARVPDARFAIIGDGPLRDELQALASRLRIRDAVSFEGECDDMPERYRALDLLMLTSWHEGAPLALLEAMACGLPVVATDVGGVPEIVVSGKTGWLATPGDEADMAERAVALLHGPETMRRFGRAARERARTQFSLDEQAKRTAELLRQLAREAPKSSHGTSARPTLASARAGPR